jgi:hypothetical protein
VIRSSMSVQVTLVLISVTEVRIWRGREDRRSEVPPAPNPDPPTYTSSRSGKLSRGVK